MQKKIKFYKENGYVVINIFNDKQFIFMRDYFINKIYNLAKIKEELREELPLKYYHLWFNKEKIDHDLICHRTNRYEYAKPKIKNLIDKNKKINFFLKSINIKKRKLWDDGFGWIGFRLVRPNFNDGYPLSSKSMGFAKNVVSCWMPLINMQKNETLSFVPKSHTKTYKTYLPKNSKFEKTDNFSKVKTNLNDNVSVELFIIQRDGSRAMQRNPNFVNFWANYFVKGNIAKKDFKIKMVDG